MSAVAILFGVIATMCILFAAVLLKYETIMDFITDLALAAILLGLASCVIGMAVQIVKSSRPPG
jgi:hypothetical protein